MMSFFFQPYIGEPFLMMGKNICGWLINHHFAVDGGNRSEPWVSILSILAESYNF
jgi:hypothetical protein